MPEANHPFITMGIDQAQGSDDPARPREQAKWIWGMDNPDDGYSVEDLRGYGWAPGGYVGTCRMGCGGRYHGAKRCLRCRPCAVKALEDERANPKPVPLTPVQAALKTFEDAYWIAVETSDPQRWMEAAAFGKQLANAVRKASS